MNRRMPVAMLISLAATIAVAQTAVQPGAERAVRDVPAETQRQTPQTDFGTVMRTGARAPDFGTLLGDASALRRAVEREAAQAAREAQAFGDRIAVAERRDLQSTCAALVANEHDAQSQRQLQAVLARHGDTAPATVLRFCLDPAYARLADEIAATERAIQRVHTSGANAAANVDLQNALQQQRRTFTTLSNVMKTRHDTVKNSINNVR